MRARIGAHEDQFFATVFLGSSLLFVAMYWAAAAVLASLVACDRFDAASPLDARGPRACAPRRSRSSGGSRSRGVHDRDPHDRLADHRHLPGGPPASSRDR